MYSIEQKDALTELINIGFGRAAGALSNLVNQRIYLEAPEVSVLPTADLEKNLVIATDQVITIQQAFTGAISGEAVMFLDLNSAIVLVDLISGGRGQIRRLNTSDYEAALEVGNIFLTAFLGSVGNLLKLPVKFAIPQFHHSLYTDMITLLVSGKSESQSILLVKTEFHLKDRVVSGYVAAIMEIQALDMIIAVLDSTGSEL